MSETMAVAYNLRCTTCGHVGNRKFIDHEGVLLDALGGERGVTPANTVCACGSRDFEIVHARCHRLLIGQGGDTWDPLCVLPDGHAGACKPDTASDEKQGGAG